MPRERKRNPECNAIPTRFVSQFYSDLDQRAYLTKEIRNRRLELMRDCGADSVQKRYLCDRAIFFTLRIETMEVNAANGIEKLDEGRYTCLVNTFVGILKALGLEARIKSAKTLSDFKEDDE